MLCSVWHWENLILAKVYGPVRTTADVYLHIWLKLLKTKQKLTRFVVHTS